MRCNYRIVYVKTKSALLLLIIFTILIILITLLTHSPFILRGATYKKIYKFPPPIPGSFLDDYSTTNYSYCKFNYDLPGDFTYDIAQLSVTPDLGTKGPYRVLYNVIESKQNATAPVTYSTHVTSGFIDYISEIIRLWEGPVSVAAFVPDFDATTVTKRLINLCSCLPEMSKVSVHYVFPITRPPYIRNLHRNELTCSIKESSELNTYRYLNKLPYPINACRNVARNAATTHYILVSDVELVPSEFLATSFLNLIVSQYANGGLQLPSRVFVVPVFEIDIFETIPKNKLELMKLIKEEKAVYFHRHVCSHCQKFPGLEKWLQNKEEEVKVLLKNI